MHVKISPGNSKMGSIPSVSLPAVVTCRKDCSCVQKCYAHKLERIRANVRNAYKSNMDLYTNAPDVYWREVDGAMKMSRFFRFHVSGDIPDVDYLNNMMRLATINDHCQVLCFTKKFDMVNEKLTAMCEKGEQFPENLHLIFSGWKDLDMDNPYNLPEAHVKFRDGSTTARENAVECHGNCTECATTDSGCWKLTRGQQVVFNEH